MVACEVEELAEGMKVCVLFVLFKQALEMSLRENEND